MIEKNIETAEHDLHEKANGFNPIQDDGGWEVAKMPPTSFSLYLLQTQDLAPVPSTQPLVPSASPK